jgi:hypothetical protein
LLADALRCLPSSDRSHNRTWSHITTAPRRWSRFAAGDQLGGSDCCHCVE